jgi:CheY-like chemotaxis protein/HPt (histidine-containing phosphotransfer) domain-containing protein
LDEELLEECDGVLLKPITAVSLRDALLTREPEVELALESTLLRLRGVEILVVDDVEVNLEIAERILKSEGAHVSLAQGGEEAIEMVQAGPDRFDIVLMDIQMPQVDGFAAGRAIHESVGWRLPVLAMTAGAMDYEKEACFAAGMVGHVSKPYLPDALIESILVHVNARPRGSVIPLTGDVPPEALESESESGSPFFDFPRALEFCGGNEDLVLREIRRFCQEGHLRLETLVSHFRGNRAQLMRGELHKLKGFAGMLGATSLGELGHKLEITIRARGFSDESQRVFDELRACWGQTLAEMTQFLSENDDDDSIQVESHSRLLAGARGVDELGSEIECLADLLREGDMRAVEKHAELDSRIDLVIPEVALAMREAMSRRDFRCAEVLCYAMQQCRSRRAVRVSSPYG